MNLANSLTLLRIILTPLFVIFYLHEDRNMQIYGIFIFIFASLTDWFDGYYARKTNSVTRFGQFMDPLADKVLNLSATYLLALSGYLYWWIFYIIVFRDLAITALRLYALGKNQAVITSRLAQWKTFLHMALIAIMFSQFLFRDYITPYVFSLEASYTSVLGIAWLGTGILSLYTMIDYIIENRSHLIQFWRSILRLLKLI